MENEQIKNPLSRIIKAHNQSQPYKILGLNIWSQIGIAFFSFIMIIIVFTFFIEYDNVFYYWFIESSVLTLASIVFMIFIRGKGYQQLIKLHIIDPKKYSLMDKVAKNWDKTIEFNDFYLETLTSNLSNQLNTCVVQDHKVIDDCIEITNKHQKEIKVTSRFNQFFIISVTLFTVISSIYLKIHAIEEIGIKASSAVSDIFIIAALILLIIGNFQFFWIPGIEKKFNSESNKYKRIERDLYLVKYNVRNE